MLRLTLTRSAAAVAFALLALASGRLSADDDAARTERWVKALQHTNPDVREAAALALLKQGAKAKAALPALTKLLREEKEANVRAAASRALLEIDEAVAHEDLLRRLGDAKLPADERRKVCRALAASYRDEQATVAALEAVLADADVQEIAAAAIKTIRARRGLGPVLLRTIKGGGGPLTFSPDGNTLASVAGTEVKLWDALTGKEAAAKGGVGDVHCLAFGPDSQTLASARADNRIQLWDVKTGQFKLWGVRHSVESLVFSADGKTLTGTNAGGSVQRWDVVTRQERSSFSAGNGVHAALSADGKTVAVIDNGADAWLTDLETQNQIAKFSREDVGDGRLVALSPSGKTLACVLKVKEGEQGQLTEAVLLLDLTTRENTTELAPRVVLKAARVNAVTFGPDGKIVATAGAGKSDDSGEIKLWDARTGQELATLQDDKPVQSVAFSPDGTTLATANSAGTIKLWAPEVVLAPARK